MRGRKIDRAMLKIDDDPVEPAARHDLHGLDRGNGGDGAKGWAALAPFLAQTIEGSERLGHRLGLPLSDQAGRRPPKKGVSATVSLCGRLEVKINSAPASS